MKTIATHQNPDHDALCSAWLIARNIIPSSPVQILFVPQGTPADHIEANFVTDIGGKYDCVKFFDHHQDGHDTTTSATSRVFTRLWSESFTGDELRPLKPLVEWVTDGDWGRTTPNNLIFLLEGLKIKHASDAEQAAIVFAAYDHIASMLAYGHQFDQAVRSFDKGDKGEFTDFIAAAKEYRTELSRDMEQKITWQGLTKGGITMCLIEGSSGKADIDAAYDLGYDVVFFQANAEREGRTIYERGVNRRNEVSHRVNLATVTTGAITHEQSCLDKNWEGQWIEGGYKKQAEHAIKEMSSWFCHPAGFYAGLSSKADTERLYHDPSDGSFRAAVYAISREIERSV